MITKYTVLLTALLGWHTQILADDTDEGGPDQLTIERAERIMAALPGHWSFTLGANTSGKRKIEALYPGMVVRWSETFDGREVLGDGFIGWDSRRGEFFSMSVHNLAGEYGHMKGSLSDSTDVIEWRPGIQKDGARPFRSRFELKGPDQFTSTALVQGENGNWEAAWVATFNRIKTDDP